MIHNSSSGSELLPGTDSNSTAKQPANNSAEQSKDNSKPKSEAKDKSEKNKQEEDDKDRKPKPKKKKRDSGYTKALEEASKTIRKAEKDGKQRVNTFESI